MLVRSVVRRFSANTTKPTAPAGSRSSLPAAIGLVTAGAILGSNFDRIDEFFKNKFHSIERPTEGMAMTQEKATRIAEPVLPPPLPYLSDQVFENMDNLLVFMFPSEEKSHEQSIRVKKIISEFQSAQKMNPSLQPVKLMYTIVPPMNTDDALVDNMNVEIMCYKGQRKLRSSIASLSKAPIEKWCDFFQFRSTPVEEELIGCNIEHVCGDDFEEKIVDKSLVENPILVQFYEKSCFLCFLMRPFLNQLATLLSPQIPVTFKRMDIEENDFPPSMPVVRGTPTFVLYQGRDRPYIRYEEFKPRDLVRRLCLDYAIPKETESRLYDLVDKVATRFQLFSGIIMWNTESEKILDMIAGEQKHHLPTIAFDAKLAEAKDKELFNKYVSELMSEDMLKIDLIDDNVEDLKRELSRAEMHAITMGQVLGEKVMAKENIVE